ncbi:hypothetical protein BAU15_14465 [Enterococcus sp. JM4C]|uniref:Cna B-type domain-containing protein n=1 Tax=Candidatus Enterococcus huntleyi TaxID=1857217 RepID=UPI00137A3744|nr:Cna B-type domain-containing protein [Enterococcus sp. JM4C]KAF1296903.1 hypothetical protein BAU15_14465 [Enterococcus sp. JM4C]
MDRLRKILTIIGLLGILSSVVPVNAFAVVNDNGVRYKNVKLVDNTGNEVTEANTIKQNDNIKIVLDWELATSSKVSQQLIVSKQLPANLAIPDQAGNLGNDLGTYQVRNKQLIFTFAGYTENNEELTSSDKVEIKNFSGTLKLDAQTVNPNNANQETISFEDQLTRTLFYEQPTVESSAPAVSSEEAPVASTEATVEKTTKSSTENSTEESKEEKETKKETKNGKATFAADLTSSVSIEGLKVYKKPIGQNDWTPVPAGGSIMLGDSVKFEVDWSIPELNAVAGDIIKIPLSIENFSFKNTNLQDLISDGVVIGQWQIDDNRFKVIFNDKIESKDLLKNGTVEAIGAANKVGDNSHIIINGEDMMEVDIVPSPVVEIPDDPWPVASDAMKGGLVSGGSLNQLGWNLDINYKSMREYYETGIFPAKDNLLLVDELAEGTSFVEGSFVLTSSIKTMYDNGDGTFTMGQIQMGTSAPITHPGFSKINQNVGESKEAFKGRVQASPQLTYGIYKDSAGIETIILNFGSLPSTSNQIKYKKDVALTGIDKLYNDGKLTVAGRERLLEFLEAIDFQAPAFRLNFRVDVKGGTDIYKNIAEFEWNGGDVKSNDAGVRYEDVTAGVQTGEKGSIRILKKDALGTILPGIEFKLQVKNGAGVFVDYTPIDGGTAIRATDSSGLVEYKKLNPGIYRLVELVDFTDPDSEFYQATTKVTTPIGATTTTDEFEIKESDSKGFVANVVNHRQLQKTVTKVWNDGNNQDGLRPTSVQVQLYADGVLKGSSVTLNDGNNWSHTWKELPEANQGTAINYTVEEVGTVAGYTSAITTDNQTGDATVTNTHTPETISVSGTKTWNDGNNQDNIRPDSIMVNLFADDEKVKDQEVTADGDGNWAYSFTNLPKYKNGRVIDYTVTEDAVPSYTTTMNGYNITNSYTPKQTKVEVKKVWNDGNNQDGLRPNSIAVQLYANGTATGTPLTLNEGNHWKASWDNLPEKAAGQTITYTVAEVGSITGYTTVVTEGDPGKFTITNSHTPEQTSVTGTKTWVDANDQDGVRPTSITVKLLADGVEETSKNVTAEENWQYSFTNLPKYKNGQEIAYTISEVAVPNYSVTYNGYNITNSYTPGQTNVQVTKLWDDANDQDGLRPSSIDVQLFANGVAKDAPVTLTEAGLWKHTWENLDEKAAGQTIDYTVKEVGSVTGYTSLTDATNPAEVKITNSHTPAEITVSGKKTWNDADDQDGKRPTSITVNLLADGVIEKSKVVSANQSGEWKYEFTNLPKFKNGTEITYTISEEAVPDYSVNYTGFDITNSYTPGETAVIVSKVWDDNENQDGLRPTSIEVQLYADGVAKGAPITLAAPNWTNKWEHLAEKSAGQPIVYTVKEVDSVTGYTTSIDQNNLADVKITNSHTPAKTTVSGTKTWDDANDQDGKRPTSITVNLFANGAPAGSQVVEADNEGNWTYEFTDLDKFKNGQEINYTITETAVPDYSTSYNGTNIKNSYTPGKTAVTVEKVWADMDNQDGLRPTSIQVQLYANGVAQGAPETLTAPTWTYTWDTLDEKAAGQPIVYTVEEVGEVPGYTTTTATNPGSVVITNTHTPEEVDVDGSKTWTDADNQDGVRPDSITVNLLADGLKIADKVVSEATSWAYQFKDLPKFNNGQEINYTITEDAVPGYSTSYTGYTIENSYTPGQTSLSVTKAWADNDNQDGLRPTSIDVQLYADDVATGVPVTLSDDNSWHHDWTNLDEKSNGQTIVYTVREVGTVAGYTTTVDANDPANVVITNSHTPEQTEVTGKKIWNDADNQDGVRPDNIQVNLFANGELVTSQEVTADENGEWNYEFTGLDKFEAGQEITYTITEDAVANYSTSYTGTDITNSYTPGQTAITVNKVWADGDDQDGLRPASINVQLYADGVATGAPITLNEDNLWAHTWANLAVKASGQTIDYTVKEVGTVAGYTTSQVTGPGNVVITNTHTPEKVAVDGVKTWDDADNQDGVRPNSITVNLLADGEKVASKEVTADEAGNWRYEFTNLDKFKAGQEINYTITEEAVPNYSTSYTGNDIKNSYTPGKTSISVTKAWADNNNQDGLRPASIQVQLFADGAEKGEAVTLNEGNLWQHEWTGLAVKADGQTIAYTVEEVANVTGYTTTVDAKDPANVVITNSHTPATTEVTGSKTWNDADNQDGVRPEAITVNLLADGEKVASQEVKADKEGNWNYSFTNLPKFANGQAIVYSVSEEAVANYTTTYAGFDITNSYTPGQTGVTVNKVWADENNQDGLRPENISVQLFADGEKQGEAVILNAANSWTHTWTDLAEKADGKAIVYTVEEVGNVTGYKKAIDASNPTNVVITNSHTPATTEVTGSKTWNDADNQDGVRPEAITVNLLADGEKVASQEVKADKEGNWNYSFTDLPGFAKGQAIVYTVSEEAVANYTTTYEGFDITNSYTPGQTGVTVNKVWADGEDKDGLRPTTIQVQLFADGKATGEPVTLDAEMNWKHTWTELAEKADGKAIAYTVEEVSEVEGYTATVDASDPANVVITNHHTPKVDDRVIQIIGQKTWDDEDNKAGARPASITINLLADGVKVDSREVTAETDWAYSFDNLQELADERPIVYTISEETVENYTPTYDGFDVVNHYTPETTSLTVNKVWDDSNDQDKLRAKSIEVQLLANGQPVEPIVTLSEENNWTASWTELAKEADGKVIEYTVEEISEVKGYVATVTKLDETNQTITNKHTPEIKQPDPKDPTEPKAPAKPVTPATPKAPKKEQPKKKLPKTGEEINPFVSYLGVSLIALVALLEQRRRAKK